MIITTIINKTKEGISTLPAALWVLYKKQLLIYF